MAKIRATVVMEYDVDPETYRQGGSVTPTAEQCLEADRSDYEHGVFDLASMIEWPKDRPAVTFELID